VLLRLPDFYLWILGLCDALADEKLGASAFQAVQ
jgi:hypothetical protein